MPKSTKKSKTKEQEQTAVLEETPSAMPNDLVVERLDAMPNDPVVERLDKIIELLTLIAKDTDKVPFKGLDMSKWRI